jgi:quercetin dioxygenase-like cupin family protein
VLQGPVEIHTEFYEPILLQTGESIYIDSTMGHAYVAPKGNDDALVLGICSSADEDLMESLMTLHADASPPAKARAAPVKRLAGKR